MSKAGKFIEDCTRNCSNVSKGYRSKGISIPSYCIPWLTPDQARGAVEIEREELIEKACAFLKSYRQDTHDGTGYIAGIVNDKTIEDFKKYMKGE